MALNFDHPITLVGGGALDQMMLTEAMRYAPVLIAADGAGERLIEMGHRPTAVIGDMDSITDQAALERLTRVVPLAEQETTDFEKCLYTAQAPLYLAVGFTGRRLDHTLAVFDTMMRRADQTVILLGEKEVLALVPPQKRLDLTVGTGSRVSFVALSEATGTESVGLEWSIDGLTMALGQQVGTSNRAVADQVQIAFDRPGVLMMLERDCLGSLITALTKD